MLVEILKLVHERSSINSCSEKKVNARNSHLEVFCQKGVLKNSLKKLQTNIFAGDSFLIKLKAGNLKLSEKTIGGVL